MLKQFLKFIKYYGKNRSIKIFLFICISVLAGCLEFIGVGLVYPFLIMVIKPNNSINLFNNFINEFYQLILIGFLIILMFVLKNILMIICTYLQNKFVISWKNDINEMLMKFYLYAPYKKLYADTNSEKIYNLTVLSSQTLETFVLRTLVFITNGIIIFLILTLLLIKFSLIALFTIILVALCLYCLNKFFKKRTEVLAPKMLEFSLKNNNQVIENVKNLKEIRIFSAEKFFLNKFLNIQRENNNVIFKNSFFAAIPPYMVEMLLVMALIIIAGFITYQNINDSSKIIASYGLILAVIFRIAPSLNRIQVAMNHMNSSKEMIKKMNEEYEKNNFDKFSVKSLGNEEFTYKNSLKLKNVNFGYKENVQVLKDISFEIKKGEIVGITGLSGAGKSTLADIIMGLLPVDSGEIFVDDKELTLANVDSYRQIISYVPQDMNILDESYKNNVAWGIEEDKIDIQKVKECIKRACLNEVVESNGGLNSKIAGLSQGQKQRLMIARALYKNPEIIVLDEATSALDVETEKEIMQMLKSIKGEKTIIIIAHRLATLKECDKLIYVKSGEIVDIGSYTDIKNRNEDFKNLIKLSKF